MFDRNQVDEVSQSKSEQSAAELPGAEMANTQNGQALPSVPIKVDGASLIVSDEPLPRAPRRPRRAKADRGLPPDEDLARLATAYLTLQREKWPKLVAAGLLPTVSEDVIREMVDDFKARHRGEKDDAGAVRPFVDFGLQVGGDYNRYSCDGSNSTSIDDQMHNVLLKAHAETVFVPWMHVFCDYSVSGLDASRQGYSQYKKILRDPAHSICTTYVDDFTRMSRDELEWWKLASFSKRLRKRMIGASDGFDLTSPDGEMKVAMYGLLSRLFMTSLRQKVKRGMQGAARRGSILGRPSLGFTRKVRRDANGNIVRNSDGNPKHEICLDPVTMESRLLAFSLFLDSNWSLGKIARHFNHLKVDGSDGWTARAIRKLLSSPSSIGVFVWNQTRREFDAEEEKWVVLPNPGKEWDVHRNRDLAITTIERWKAARRELGAAKRVHPLTGRKQSRNQKSATTLFSGTLVCECGHELVLNRSAGEHKSMFCPNGAHRAHGCKLITSKSTRIIEQSLLDYICNVILSEATIDDLVSRANAFLEEESCRPTIDTRALKTRLRKLRSKCDNLMGTLEDLAEKELRRPYEARINTLQKEIRGLADQIQEADTTNRKPPPPLDAARLKSYLPHLREIFNQAIPVAAEAIRMLTGPIVIRQEPVAGRQHGARWIATFSPDFLALLRRVAKERDYPESCTLEFLSTRNWILPIIAEVPIEKIPGYERLAPEIQRKHIGRASRLMIAAEHGVSTQMVDNALRFAETGERPTWSAKQPAKNGAPARNRRRYVELAPKAAKLRDEESLSFPAIGKRLGVSEGTARRAYDYAHPEKVRDAVEHGVAPNRGPYSILGGEKLREIESLLRETDDVKQVAEKAGCSQSTVRRVIAKNMPPSNEAGVAKPKPVGREAKAATNRDRAVPKYKALAAAVARLHDEQRVPFMKIEFLLTVSSTTVRSAYDWAHPEIREALANGEEPIRAPNSRLGAAKLAKIRRLIAEKWRTCDIIREVGCSRKPIERLRKQVA